MYKQEMSIYASYMHILIILLASFSFLAFSQETEAPPLSANRYLEIFTNAPAGVHRLSLGLGTTSFDSSTKINGISIQEVSSDAKDLRFFYEIGKTYFSFGYSANILQGNYDVNDIDYDLNYSSGNVYIHKRIDNFYYNLTYVFDGNEYTIDRAFRKVDISPGSHFIIKLGYAIGESWGILAEHTTENSVTVVNRSFTSELDTTVIETKSKLTTGDSTSLSIFKEFGITNSILIGSKIGIQIRSDSQRDNSTIERNNKSLINLYAAFRIFSVDLVYQFNKESSINNDVDNEESTTEVSNLFFLRYNF